MKTAKYNEVEKLVHKTIDRLTDLRRLYANLINVNLISSLVYDPTAISPLRSAFSQ